MTLLQLNAKFLKTEDGMRRHRYVDTLAEAQGIMFDCPLCFAANGGPVGTHAVIVWFDGRDVPSDEPSPRWTASGTGLENLTLVPSIHLIGSCGWHGFVTNGSAA